MQSGAQSRRKIGGRPREGASECESDRERERKKPKAAAAAATCKRGGRTVRHRKSPEILSLSFDTSRAERGLCVAVVRVFYFLDYFVRFFTAARRHKLFIIIIIIINIIVTKPRQNLISVNFASAKTKHIFFNDEER